MKKFLIAIFVFTLFSFVSTAKAYAACDFVGTSLSWELQGSCTTDVTILIPDGYVLDGNGFTITAVDPDGDHFKGAVVMNGGVEAYVEHLNVTTDSLSNTCDGGADRLRGIMFEGASGSILHSNIYGINQGESGCQEGNAVEIRNEPFNGTHPNTMSVEIGHSTITEYQKTGIVANGDVNVNIHHNKISSSATQANLAANSVQLGWGASGKVMHNFIDGNEWLGESNWAATAILIYHSDGVEVSQNIIGGNSEIGIYNLGNSNIINNNKITDEGVDLATHVYDYGIGNWGSDSVITNNKVKGFDNPYGGVDGGKNKVIPGSQPDNLWF